MNYRYIGKPLPRVDGPDKVCGTTRYMTDLHLAGALAGRALRSPHPHALIRRIDTARAKALPGVVCVLTAADVPGLNAFGIIIQDQPVLARDKVRMTGDAVALVAAESEEIAEQALALIEVDYEPLPAVTDPEAALRPDAPRVHPEGNLLKRVTFKRGDVAGGFADAAAVVEGRFHTPRQMHAFLENEGGWAQVEADGTLTIRVPAQAAYRDRLQVARILGWNPERIRIISNPLGGGFGGKDELTVQHYLALLALHSGGRPVKLHYKREESVVAGIKRHPFQIDLKLGARADGSLCALQARLVADKGAYASLGPAVLQLAVEHICGPYKIENIDVEGLSVYTNNGCNGAFRGFGVPQTCFALESSMDMLAQRLGLDPIAIRKGNVYRRGDVDAVGTRVESSVGVWECLDALERSDLYRQRDVRTQTAEPFAARGVGVACSLHGVGLGKGLPDFAGARLTLLPDGHFELDLAPQEIGQGNTMVYTQFAAEALGCDLHHVTVVQGDTARVPDGGTVTASRATYAGGRAALAAAENMVALLRAAAADCLGIDRADVALVDGAAAGHGRRVTFADLHAHLTARGKGTVAEGHFILPTADHDVDGLTVHYVCGYAAHLALVEVGTLTGEAQLLEAVCAVDCGKVINPLGLEGQCEGGVVMGMGMALYEDTIMDGGVHRTKNFATYILPTTFETPQITTIPIETLEETGPFGAKGIGEVVMVPIVAAIPNAIAAATGCRIHRLPATPERVWQALQARGVTR